MMRYSLSPQLSALGAFAVNLKLKLELKEWRLKAPFITATEVINAIQVLQVTVSQGGIFGRAETMGVDYLNETIESLQAELAALDPAVFPQTRPRNAPEPAAAWRQSQWSRLRALGS